MPRLGCRLLASMAAAIGVPAAFAQYNAGFHAIEVSPDRGQTWRGGVVEVDPGPRTVLVRHTFRWNYDPGYAFAGAHFDAAVIADFANADEVSDALRVYPYSLNTNQTIVATRFGNTIKIDDARDTLPFGLGTRGVFPGQLVENFAPPGGFVAENPAAPFRFALHLDGTPGDRLLDMRYVTSAQGGFGYRVYTSPAGAQHSFSSPYPGAGNLYLERATVRVLPAPHGALAVLLGIAAVRRRR